jgi:hypothetical protein
MTNDNGDVALIASCMELIEKYEGRFGRAYDYDNRRRVGIGFDLGRPDAPEQLASVGLDYGQVRSGAARLSNAQIKALFENELEAVLQYARQKLPWFDGESLEKKAVIVHVIFDHGCRNFERLDEKLARLNGGCRLLAARYEDAVPRWHDERLTGDMRHERTRVHSGLARNACGNSAGFLTQGYLGKRGNFELLVPHSDEGVAHYWRDNDNQTFPWSGPALFARSLGKIDSVSVVKPQPGGTAVLESVVLFGNDLAYYWREGSPHWTWHGPSIVATGVSGNPGLVRRKIGMSGTLDVVIPLKKAGIAHYWRPGDGSARSWKGPEVFGLDLGQVDGVTATQTNLGSLGTLEVVARAGDRLVHYWRGGGPAEAWHGPKGVCDGATGVPAVIQGKYGLWGNLELVTPLQAGGVAHFWCNNDGSDFEWSGPTAVFGTGDVLATSLLESNFGSPALGNLEVAAQDDKNVRLYWRRDGAPWIWRCSRALHL